jgi:hypothetical protein
MPTPPTDLLASIRNAGGIGALKKVCGDRAGVSFHFALAKTDGWCVVKQLRHACTHTHRAHQVEEREPRPESPGGSGGGRDDLLASIRAAGGIGGLKKVDRKEVRWSTADVVYIPVASFALVGRTEPFPANSKHAGSPRVCYQAVARRAFV